MSQKILIVTNHYLPGFKAGGPIKSVSSLCENLKSIFNITIMTSSHDFGEVEPYKNIEFDKLINFNDCNIIYLSNINAYSIFKKITLLNVDIIYLNSFFSKLTIVILVLKKLKLIRAKIILAPRGELSQGALSIKQNKKLLFLKFSKFINLHDKKILFHATCKMEKEDINKLFSNKVSEIPNLSSNLNDEFKSASKSNGELRLVFLSRICVTKNLLYALEILKHFDNKNIIFDVYGPKEDVNYWNQCNIIINSYKFLKVTYKGVVIPTDISKVFSQYHMFFLPTKNENFGHVIVEAMQAGLIPLISDQTPWNDLQEHDAGYSLNLTKKYIFVKSIMTVLNFSQEEFNSKSDNVKRYIDKRLDNKISITKYTMMFENTIHLDENS